MQDLSQYIVETLPDHDAVISELSSAIEKTRRLFATIPFRGESDAWGYRVLDEQAEAHRGEIIPDQKLSQSTTSMIVASLLLNNKTTGRDASSGFPWTDYHLSETFEVESTLDERVMAATELLEATWRAANGSSAKLKSTTYGENDILSLSWHFDVFRSELSKTNISSATSIVQDIKEILLARASLFVNAETSYHAICDAFRDQAARVSPDARVGESSYILLRFVRCLRALKEIKPENDAQVRSAMARAGKRLQSKLHDHLSLAEITDSRFDPAELAFCLEGLLHLKPEQVDFALLDRAISVLGKAQAQSAYWRSETPIVIQQRGHVLFPIGVEVARSILNALALFVSFGNSEGRKQEFHAKHLMVLKRYWAWLKSRQTTIQWKGSLLSGWHSEHVNDPDLVHTWESSQILEFLIGFRAVLKAHVANELLALSRLEVRQPGKAMTWENVVENYEPYYREPHNIYARIGTDFVQSRMPGAVGPIRNWSMLLYGPPGTGKSTVAENLGDCLRMPVITVTVSDFLGEGESRMESRVKNIFTVIERQTGAIILFDEMDQFLLDRNSELFRRQDSVFQFLTPGMLTKFASLRKRESVIFIIATNYEERIDPAIKRAGRIDQRYLVLPPDNRRRMKILLGDAKCQSLLGTATEDEKQQLLEMSCLLAYTDIKRVAAQAPATLDDLLNWLQQASRNIQFAAMEERYSDSPTKGLEEEIKGLITLIDEAQITRMTTDAAWEGSVDFRAFIAKLPQNSNPRKLHDELDRQKDQSVYKTQGGSSRSRKGKP